jgi:CDP-diacylglycerol--glycerol-3-phosphate 3-phosphatidyltransferase
MFDWARGSRIDSTGQSSNTMCLNLADKFGSRVTTSFLHAPVHGKVDTDLPKPKSVVLPGQATVCTTVPAAQPGSAFNQPPPAPLQALRAAAGFARNFLPGRLGELFAVHHAKLYLFDDRVILSGANASEVYFHQRHDRYWGVTDGPLCNWLVAFATTVAMSKHARVAVGGVTAYETPEHWIYSPHWSPYARHKTGVAPARAQTDPLLHCVAEDVLMSQQAVSELKLEVEDTATVASLRALMQASHAKQPTDAARAADAASGRVLVIPALEWGAMGIRHDSAMQQALLECVAACKASLTIATGYFNPRRRDVAAWRALGKQTDVTVVTGSALSNGWGDAKGVTAQVPLLYNEVIRKCMRKWRNTNVQLREFIKPNWSFHAKGWWASSGKGVVTVLGSSNYNVRSAERDNELQFYVLIPEGPLARAVEKERQECIDGSQAALGKPEAHWAAKMLLPILRRFM